jgi:hypothetical protein
MVALRMALTMGSTYQFLLAIRRIRDIGVVICGKIFSFKGLSRGEKHPQDI